MAPSLVCIECEIQNRECVCVHTRVCACARKCVLMVCFPEPLLDKNSRSLKAILVNGCTFPRSIKNDYINIARLLWVPDPALLMKPCPLPNCELQESHFCFTLTFPVVRLRPGTAILFCRRGTEESQVQGVCWESTYCTLYGGMVSRIHALETQQGAVEMALANGWGLA